MRTSCLALAGAFALIAAAPAAAQATVADYRAALACFAITEKMAIENERGWKSFAAAAGRDARNAPKLEQMRAEQERNIALKRTVAATIQRNAAAMLRAGYPAWAAAGSLPPAADLERRELEAARREAAGARNIQQLSAMLDSRSCERFLVAPTANG